MTDPSPTIETTPRPGIGRIIAGISITTVWALAHVVLFYLFFASGAIVDIILNMVRAFMFPGTSQTLAGNHELFGWTGILQTGLILAGAAGIPAGVAVFWRSRRKVLMRSFWIFLVAGALCEIHALYLLVTTAFSV